MDANKPIYETESSASDPHVYVLQNSQLAVTVLPAEGGRVASLRSLHTGVEFLTQPLKSGFHVQSGLSASFQDGPCAGIEECLPTVGPCGPDTEGGPAPDHGDFWQLAWKVTEATSTRVRLHAVGFSRPLLFCKELSLEGSELRIHYCVENLQAAPTSFLYACHPLFAVAEGDRIVLRPEAQALTLYYSRRERLGAGGSILGWPRTLSGVRLDVVGARTAGTAEMLYTGRLSEGCSGNDCSGHGYCGVYRCSVRQGLTLSFDALKLPYLGLWLCYGGWPDKGAEPRQSAVAMEPTNAPCNTLAEAQRTGSALRLGAGESIRWDIRFRVSVAGMSFATFCALSQDSQHG